MAHGKGKSGPHSYPVKGKPAIKNKNKGVKKSRKK